MEFTALARMSKEDDSRAWLARGFVVSTLLAPFLAAHTLNPPADANVFLGTLYWFARLTAAFALYVGALLLLEATPLKRRGGWVLCAAVAVVATLVPFVMVITMLDLAVGLPELDGAIGDDPTLGVFAWLMRECLYLSDNHLFYCIIVTLPRFWVLSAQARQVEALPTPYFAVTDRETFPPKGTATTAPDMLAAGRPNPSPPDGRYAFLQHAKPALHGDLRYIEAQEHYIRVATSTGSGLALYRFGDALRDLEGEDGIQVHRSFWVSRRVVRSVERSRAGLKLVLDDGGAIPVSRRYERDVSLFFKELEA